MNKLNVIDYVDEKLIEKAENYKITKKYTFVKWALAACLCAVAVVILIIPKINRAENNIIDSNTELGNEQNSADTENQTENEHNAVDTDNQTEIEQNNEKKGTETKADYCYFWWKNKLSVGGQLYQELENKPDIEHNIIATYSPATANITSFVYEGESLAELAIKAYEENASYDVRAKYKKAYHAYLETVLPPALSILSENNIKCERAAYVNNSIIFQATATQLENLPLDDLENWRFELYSNEMKK